MKKWIKIALFLFSGLFLMTNFGFAAKSKGFTIGVEKLKYLPHFDRDDRDYIGFTKELLDKFAESKGYSFTYKFYSVENLTHAFLKKKNLDFKYPDNPGWQFEKKTGFKVQYSTSVVGYIDGVLVKPNNRRLGIRQLRKMGTIKGFTTLGYTDLINSSQLVRVDVSSVSRLIASAMRGEVDGIYLNIDVANYYLDKIQRRHKGLVFDSTLPFTKGSYYLSTIKQGKVLKEFNKFLVRNKAEIDRLKYIHGVGVYDIR